ncbi:MAG: hypothetical protein KF729_02190 [Sandaracinaceae bacterium]|nr:hypothetical protein [Sandaracinaceae bacterium]
MTDPPRLLDDPTTDDALRDALAAGRAEHPTEAQLEALAARLGPLLGGPGGDGGGTEGAPIDPSPALAGTKAALAAKALVGLGLAAGLAAVAVWVASPEPASAPPPPRPAPVASVEPPPPEPAAPPPGLDVPEDLAADEPAEPVARARAERPRPAYEVDPAAELDVLRRSQDALRTDPSGALALAREHERRFGPAATLAQEREVVAIDALVRLGRSADARARADAFRARWPRSAHLRRIDVLLE